MRPHQLRCNPSTRPGLQAVCFDSLRYPISSNTLNRSRMFTRFDANKSTKGASKLRRDLINAEIANLRDLLPLPPSTRQRLSQLQLMALVCVYVRKTNYFQQAFKCHNVNLQASTPSIGFSKALNGFLMMMTQNGKLLYISDNAAEYLGHSMEDLLIHGDSVYDIIDKQDHPVIQAEMARSAGSEDEARMFMCRINVTRNARRQMRFGDQKVVLVQGHYLSFLPLCSRNEPVFIATCTPIAMPETRECVVQGATNVFTSIHSMDMKFMYLDRIGEYHLGFLWVELQGVSWYKLLHWECMQEAQAKHRLITQSDQDRACILLVRLQRRMGDWIWVHCVLQVKDSVENNQHPVIVCTNQILSDREAVVMRSNSWLYEYYMVQSKLQYGLTYAGTQSAVSRSTPYYHHHSPQPPTHPTMHHIHQPDTHLSTPPNSGHASVQPSSEHLPPVEIRANPPHRHNIEKLEPVDYSLHQPSTQYHICPPIGRCFSSSSTGEDSLDTFTRQQVDDAYIHQYRSIVTVTQCNANSYSSDSPDMYSYQVLGGDTQGVPETSGFGTYTQKYVEEDDQRRVGDLIGAIPRYRGKFKKSSTGSISSTVTVPQSERDHFPEDDDVFLNQWKPLSQQRLSPDTGNIDYHHKAHLEKLEEPTAGYHTTSDQTEEEINRLGFQSKRRLLMPLSKCEYKEPKSPRFESGTGGVLTDWSDPENLHHPNLFNYESVRPSLVYANKETLCYWKHLESYAKTHLELTPEKFTLCNIERPKSTESLGDGCGDTRFHYNHHWTADKWIYPLHPPLPAAIDTSPLSAFPSSYSELSPVSSNNVMHYIMPPDIFPKSSTLVDEVIF